MVTIRCDRNDRRARSAPPNTRRSDAAADLSRLPAALVREHGLLGRAGDDGARRVAPGLRHHRIRLLGRAHRILLVPATGRLRAVRRCRRRHHRPSQAGPGQFRRVVRPLRHPGRHNRRGRGAGGAAVRDRRPPGGLLRGQLTGPQLDDRPAAAGRTAARRQRPHLHDQHHRNAGRADARRARRRLVGLPGRVHRRRRHLHRLALRDVAAARHAAGAGGGRGGQAGIRRGRAALPGDQAQSPDDLLHRSVRHGAGPPPGALPRRRRPLVRR